MEKKRTNEEKIAMHDTEYILRKLNIKKSTRAYVFLLDVIDIAKSEPEVEIREIVEFLKKNRYYVGIQPDTCLEGAKDNSFMPAVRRTIESAIENADDEYLRELKLDKLNSILDGQNSKDELLKEIGEKYQEYEYNEQILIYFVTKVLKAMK